jgi:GNAT superfamily N-acetyltransferase
MSFSPATLRDGRDLEIRHVESTDGPALLAFMQALSEASRRFRFFSAVSDLHTAARWAAGADGTDQIGILGLDHHGRVLGHAACCRLDGSRAEVAVEVSETERHQGLATLLIARLAEEAEAAGIGTFIAEVLPDNRQMLDVFGHGFAASRRLHDGEVDIQFPTSGWRLVRERVRAPEPDSAM